MKKITIGGKIFSWENDDEKMKQGGEIRKHLCEFDEEEKKQIDIFDLLGEKEKGVL
jgi:hypothetical protein